MSSLLRCGKLFFVAGPCVIESESLCLLIARRLAACARAFGVPIFFKASWDKANRTSRSSFRGRGKAKGLAVLRTVRSRTGLPVVTDVHETADVDDVAAVADIIQIPALLCRQTDLLLRAAATGKWVNVKKGQFMSPTDMRYVVEKVGKRCIITERGSCFGYNRLVVDFTGIATLKNLGVPVVFDATHSVQIPGGGNGSSGGNRELALPLAQAAVCHGVNGLFFEVHPRPDGALCDGPNSLSLAAFEKNIPRLLRLQAITDAWR
jgi:2-dehydro-3-deoxyphosphooctonate aldolase (KDO 8-P synthase)